MDGKKDFRSAKPLRDKATSLMRDKFTRGEGSDLLEYYKSLEATHTLMQGKIVVECMSVAEICEKVDKILDVGPLVWAHDPFFVLLCLWVKDAVVKSV